MYSSKLYIDITKSKSSVSSIVVLSIFVIHLMNSAQVAIATWVLLSPIIVTSLLIRL